MDIRNKIFSSYGLFEKHKMTKSIIILLGTPQILKHAMSEATTW